jgi:DNA primase large subunit
VLNPFSDEARKIVEASPALESLHTEIKELAVGRIKWSDKEALVQPDSKSVQAEVLSFYLMCQGTAAVSYPYSREVKFVGDITRKTMRYRVYDMFRRGEEELCLEAVRRFVNVVELASDEGKRLIGREIPRDDVYRIRDMGLQKDGVETVDDRLLPQYLPKYAVRWVGLASLMRHRRLELTDLYMLNGWAVITPRDLWYLHAELVGVETEEYIQSVYERLADAGAPSPLLVDIGNKISSFVPRLPEFKEMAGRAVAGRLRPEFFPPCVNISLSGVGSGARNYAIIMLLTPFLSRARAAPPPAATRMVDYITDISAVTEEVAPLIFEAAEHCNPPLFKDQPQEKANVFHKMGFGMTTEPRLTDSGKSTWYSVPNCSKVQMSAPSICKPDEFCRFIKSPLTYYFRKSRERGVAAQEAGK